MTIAECKAMRSGQAVLISEGNGWFRDGRFLKMIEVITFGRMTLSDLMRKDFDLGKERKEQRAMVEYVDDNGRTRRSDFRPSRIRKDWT